MLTKLTELVMHRTKMDGTPLRTSGSGPASRKSSTVVVIGHDDIAEIKVRRQSAYLLAQQLQQQLILQQQQLQRIRRDQVTILSDSQLLM